LQSNIFSGIPRKDRYLHGTEGASAKGIGVAVQLCASTRTAPLPDSRNRTAESSPAVPGARYIHHGHLTHLDGVDHVSASRVQFVGRSSPPVVCHLHQGALLGQVRRRSPRGIEGGVLGPVSHLGRYSYDIVSRVYLYGRDLGNSRDGVGFFLV
jgi:hypothetical protein